MMDFQTFKEKIKTIKVVYSVSRNIPSLNPQLHSRSAT